MDEIISMALGNGIWAALFCFLFLYMLKDSRTRESRYTATIETLGVGLKDAAEALKVCEKIKVDCECGLVTTRDVKRDTEQIKEDVEALRVSRERL